MLDSVIEENSAPGILIVDDTPANLLMLVEMLKILGYRPRPVLDGRQALETVRKEPPDLILLDINMPDMDGFQVCQQLKLDPKARDIPVIFISASTEVMDKVQAFSVGAVDFVTKPFQLEEVSARVAAHLSLRQQKLILQVAFDKLKRAEQMRDNLLFMMVHDFRSPLIAIQMLIDVCRKRGEGVFNPALQEDMQQIRNASIHMLHMVNSLLDTTKLEAGEMKLKRGPCEISPMIEGVFKEFQPMLEGRRIELKSGQSGLCIMADYELLLRIIANLLSNAVKYTSRNGCIRMGAEQQGAMVQVWIEDNGPGIPKEFQKKIFEKFGQAELRALGHRNSTGLGLAFCKLAVEAHGGRIGVESEVEQGSRFWFSLPSV